MISVVLAFSTLGLSLRSLTGPVERALLGFPYGLFQPASLWGPPRGVWLGTGLGWEGIRSDTLTLLDDPALDPDSVPFEIPIRIPLTTRLLAAGGMNFLGGVWPTRWGMVGFGTGNPFGNAVTLEGTSIQQLSLDLAFRDTLTAQEIPDLSPGDRIPVSIRLAGDLSLSLAGDAGLAESRAPFALHLVREKPWGSWGVGILLEDVWIRAEGSASVGLEARVSTEASTVVDPASGWSLEGVFRGAFQDTVLFSLSLSGELRTLQPSIGLGVVRRFSFWHIQGAVDAGLWGTLPVDASGNLVVRFLMPTEEPSTVSWTWDSLQVDTAARVIRGGGTIGVGALRDTVVEVARVSGTLPLAGAWGIRLGFALQRPLEFSLSAALTDGSGGVERGEFQATLGGTLQNVGLHLVGGFVHARTRLGDLVTGWLPVAYGGIRLGITFSRLLIRTGILYQSSQAAFQFLSEQGRLSRPIWLVALGYVP